MARRQTSHAPYGVKNPKRRKDLGSRPVKDGDVDPDGNKLYGMVIVSVKKSRHYTKNGQRYYDPEDAPAMPQFDAGNSWTKRSKIHDKTGNRYINGVYYENWKHATYYWLQNGDVYSGSRDWVTREQETEAVEQTKQAGKVVNDVIFEDGTSDIVIDVLRELEEDNENTRVNIIYGDPKTGKRGYGHKEGYIHWSSSPTKPLILKNKNSSKGKFIETARIVKIVTTGSKQEIRYQHPGFDNKVETVMK